MCIYAHTHTHPQTNISTYTYIFVYLYTHARIYTQKERQGRESDRRECSGITLSDYHSSAVFLSLAK